MTESEGKQPVLFLSHGGGPSFFMKARDFPSVPFIRGIDKDSRADHYFRTMESKEGLNTHKAILVISAHWEEHPVAIQATPQPTLYFDYHGFPMETYKLKWPAIGNPELAHRIKNLLESKGIECETETKRGYDHGVFIPLMLIFPKPEVPVLQLSLDANLSTESHLCIGEALRELREEGVMIVGSGFTTHRFFPGGKANHEKQMQEWVHDLLTNPKLTAEERRQRLATCHEESQVKEAHPRIEHFLPFLVSMAAANYTPGKVLFTEFMPNGGLFEHYIFRD